jgi:hypothetical protein
MLPVVALYQYLLIVSNTLSSKSLEPKLLLKHIKSPLPLLSGTIQYGVVANKSEWSLQNALAPQQPRSSCLVNRRLILSQKSS